MSLPSLVGDTNWPAPVPIAFEFATLPILCFSHLRWDFVYQRPQHLMDRFAKVRSVYFIEEPQVTDDISQLRVSRREHGLHVVTPLLLRGLSHDEANRMSRQLVDDFLVREKIRHFVAWYYTPMMFSWSRHLRAAVTVYDCMDELSLFRGAPAGLVQLEQQLFQRADVVFTGGASLYQAKRKHHPRVYCYPSSIDRKHFVTARTRQEDPHDQASIPHIRLGFAGVIDERMDLALVDAIASRHPDWHLIFVGPVVKIDPATLPRRENIHYLGQKAYADLPRYMAGWDAGLIPFAFNESTRFISPTKTPEYLAAGLPVVSTPIRDVVSAYGMDGLVEIGATPETFCNAIERAVTQSADDRSQWLERVDRHLSANSWDQTYHAMAGLLQGQARRRRPMAPMSVMPDDASSTDYDGVAHV